MGNLFKGTLASLPPRPILNHFRWPRPAREAPERASKALASLSFLLLIRVDCSLAKARPMPRYP
eukprot:2054620-Pyramimonas_sp.AAC.1